jgi:hypothetical protein
MMQLDWPGKQCTIIWQAFDSIHVIVLLFDKCEEISVVGYRFLVKFFILIICYGFSAMCLC